MRGVVRKEGITMGYYIRVLVESDRYIPVSDLRKELKKNNLPVNLDVIEGNQKEWEQIAIKNEKNEVIAVAERNLVAEGLLGKEEIEEFLEEIQECKPESAVEWLKEYLPRIKVIYAFRILDPIYNDNGWDIVDKVKEKLWNELEGILQADMEGFSNKDGYHILWQFDDEVEGDWWMAVRKNDEWIKFRMDLGNKAQRKAFLEGNVPDGISVIKT